MAKYSHGNYDGPDGMHGVPFWRIAGFSLTDASTNCYLFMMTFVAYYLTGFVGAGVFLAGSFSMIMRVWDGVTDPFIGMIVDKFNGKFGKNRPFLVIGNLTLFVTSWIMFNVSPMIPQSFRVVFFILVSVVYYIGYTCQAVVVKSGQSCLTNDPKQRPLFAITLGIFNSCVFAFAPLWISGTLVPKYGQLASQGLFSEMQLTLGLISFVLMCISAISLAPKDNSKYFGTGQTQTVTLKDYADAILHNRALQMLVVSASSDKLALQANTSTVSVILYGIVAGNYAMYGVMTGYVAPAKALFLIFGAGLIATKLGQKRAMIIGSIGYAIGEFAMALLWWLGDPTTLSLPGDGVFTGFSFFTIIFVALYLISMGFQGLTSSLAISMIADCSDYETYRSGKYLPGLMGTLFSFVDKMVSSVSPMIASLLLIAIGFKDTMPDVNTPFSPELKNVGIFLGFVLLGLMSVINLVAMKYYPLDREKMEEIQHEIAAIKAKAANAANA